MDGEEDILQVGRLGAAFGIKGWVKVHSDTAPRENILDYRPWLLQRNGRWEPVEVAEGQPHGKGIIVRLQGVSDRNAAEALAGLEIGIPASSLPPPAEGEYYWRDLVGLSVVNLQGELLGVVDHLEETGANDVMVLAPCPGSIDDTRRLVPWVTGPVVQRVESDAKRIVVDWERDW